MMVLQASAVLTSLHLPAPPPCPPNQVLLVRKEVAAGGLGHRAGGPLVETSFWMDGRAACIGTGRLSWRAGIGPEGAE